MANDLLKQTHYIHWLAWYLLDNSPMQIKSGGKKKEATYFVWPYALYTEIACIENTNFTTNGIMLNVK